jgi:hypothetical protein
VDAAPTVQAEVETHAVSEIPTFISQLRDGLQQEANEFVERMQTRMGGVIGTVLHEYNQELADAQASRRRSYIVAIASLGLVFLVVYLAYIKWLGRPVGQSRWEAIFWGVLINAIGDVVGLAYAKLRDHYPQTKSKIKDRELASLKDQVHSAIEDALKNFSIVQTSVLTTKLEALYVSVTSPRSDPWQASAEQSYHALRTITDGYDTTRKRYLDVIDKFARQCGSYFEDHNQNLEKLKATAQAIKEKAIEPSFKLLENTKSNLRAVRDEINAIKFH